MRASLPVQNMTFQMFALLLVKKKLKLFMKQRMETRVTFQMLLDGQIKIFQNWHKVNINSHGICYFKIILPIITVYHF